MPSPMVSMAPTSVTNTKAGSMGPELGAQCEVEAGPPPARDPEPGRFAHHPRVVDPVPGGDQAPRPPPPITDPHSRRAPVARSTIAIVIAIVASAVMGAAAGPAPSGAANTRSKPMGITVTANQHDHGPGHRRRDHTAQQGQARGDQELAERRGDDQRGQQRRAAELERRHRYRDEDPPRSPSAGCSRPRSYRRAVSPGAWSSRRYTIRAAERRPGQVLLGCPPPARTTIATVMTIPAMLSRMY